MPACLIKSAKFVLLVCLAAFAACQTPTEKDTSRLKTDAPANAEISRVNQKIASGQYILEEDISALRAIGEKYPHAPPARQILQAALIKREDWQTAADVISSVPDAEKTFDEQKNLANIFLKLGRYEDALRTANALRAEHPANTELALTAGSALFFLGRYAEAGDALDKINDKIIAGKNSEAAAMRGMIYFYAKDYPKAVEMLERAVEFDQKNAAAYNGLARIYAAQDDAAKAEQYTRKVQTVFDEITAAARRKSKFVESARELNQLFAAKKYDEVVRLAQTMIPEAEAADRAALYQFMANAFQAQGKLREAQDALAQSKK